jgi:hypothetical protein
MCEHLFWLCLGVIGMAASINHFVNDPLLVGRGWDGLFGAALLGNLIVVVCETVALKSRRWEDD